MAEELLYSSESERARLLGELEAAGAKEGLPARARPDGCEDEVDELHKLFEGVVGYSPGEAPVEEAAAAPAPSQSPFKTMSPRMTVNELQAMRLASARVQRSDSNLSNKLLQGLFKVSLSVRGWFTPREAPQSVCQDQGHVCARCGEQFESSHSRHS